MLPVRREDDYGFGLHMRRDFEPDFAQFEGGGVVDGLDEVGAADGEEVDGCPTVTGLGDGLRHGACCWWWCG